MMIASYVESDDHIAMLDVCAASAKRVMPDVPIIQFGPRGVIRSSVVDAQMEFDLPGNFARRVWRAKASVPAGDVLFADADVIFRRDVREVFQGEFDVALPEISDPYVKHSAGIAFCRNPAFWADYEAGPLCRAERLAPIREWLEDWNRFAASWHGTVAMLPAPVYEYTPRHQSDACEGAAIVHYRGPRKNWMPGFEGKALALTRAH